ncbi:hypothetical protein ALC57_11649 [Trachymyrmex cornetzi]|uniref:Uncharacterized protein n=1 Tax=Trachymyrmex cornetzi TaxID=471704 RepID=A0A195DUA7_9HYME|nr:hypothetical protein ALC57_11649 [Trachymyrmex cornetzi]
MHQRHNGCAICWQEARTVCSRERESGLERCFSRGLLNTAGLIVNIQISIRCLSIRLFEHKECEKFETLLSSYPPLPSPRFDQSLESSRLRGTPNVTAISRSVSEEDGGRNVEHDCQTRNSSFVLRCSSNQYEKRLNIEAFESSRRRLHINQRALINRQDANQERPASRSIGGLPETFRSCSPQCSCTWPHVCAYSRLQRTVQQQGYPRVRLMLSSFEIERRFCEDWKAAIPVYNSCRRPRANRPCPQLPQSCLNLTFSHGVRAEETFQLGSQSVEQPVKTSGGVRHVYRDS